MLKNLKQTFNFGLFIACSIFMLTFSFYPAFAQEAGQAEPQDWGAMTDEEPEEGFSVGVVPISLMVALSILFVVNNVQKRRKEMARKSKGRKSKKYQAKKETSFDNLRRSFNKMLGRKEEVEIVGVDITNESIVIAQLRRTKSGVELDKLVTAPTPPNSIRDGEIVDTSGVAEVLKDLLESNEIQATKAITTVSGQAIIIRTVQFPAMSPKELKEVILHEAERYIPFPIKEVNIDFQTLREIEDEGINKLEVLLVAAQKPFINSYVETFLISGLNLIAVDVASFAVARSIADSINATGLGANEPFVIVLIRGETTDITVLQSGIPRFSRSIPIGSTSFIETIANNLSISLEESIEVFDQIVVPLAGQSISDDPLIEMASNEVKTTLRELTTEIQRSLEYYQSQESIRIQHMVLSGRGARIKNLDKHFAMSLGIDVEVSNPLANVQFDQEKYSPEFLMNNAPVLATSIGLAKRGVESNS